MSKCNVKHCQMIGTDMQCKVCPDWDILILTCKECGATHQITPPKKMLKETAEIELKCYRCSYVNNYPYAHIIEVS